MLKPKVSSQMMSSMGIGRMGGAASKGSTPVPSTPGKGFAAMEQALLKGGQAKPKAVAAGKPGRQFFTKSSGGDKSLGTKGSTMKSNPTVLAALAANKKTTPF